MRSMAKIGYAIRLCCCWDGVHTRTVRREWITVASVDSPDGAAHGEVVGSRARFRINCAAVAAAPTWSTYNS